MKISLVTLLLFNSVPVHAHVYQRGYTTQRSCYKEIYREEYVAGTRQSRGYVKSFTDSVEVPCSQTLRVHDHRSIPSYPYSRTRYYHPTTTSRVSRANPASSTCRSLRATGGLLGGGLAAAVSKKDAWGWAIPLGAVVGLGVGDSHC